jgi:phenylacetyl-CoA:acceptor oxidoreductase subunit 2
MSGGAPSSFGPKPWLQQHWDARAAGNFVLGGTGSGLLALLATGAVPAGARAALALAGGALVAAGLFCVWLEIGRPLRSLNVYFNPFTSWMTREAFAGLLVFAGVALTLLTGGALWATLAGLAALAFVYCQGRILRASKGIPAWREPLVVPMVVATGLAEGTGLGAALLALLAGSSAVGGFLLAALAVLVALRAALWLALRRRIDTRVPRPGLAALDRAGRILLYAGSAAPLALIAAAAALPGARAPLAALAGLAAMGAGWTWKFVLVTQAAYNQGFALPRIPVRGAG